MESQILEEKCIQNKAHPSTTNIPKNPKREFSERGRNFVPSSNLKNSANINKGGSFYKNHYPNGKTNKENRYRGNPPAFENKNVKEKFPPQSGNSYNYRDNRYGPHRSSSYVVFNFKEGKKNNYKSMDVLTNTQNQNHRQNQKPMQRQNQKKGVQNNKNRNTSKEINMHTKTNATDNHNKMIKEEGYTMMEDQFPELNAGIKKNKKKKKKGDNITAAVVTATVEKGTSIHNSNGQEFVEKKKEGDAKKTEDMTKDNKSVQANNASNETQNISNNSPQKPSGTTTKKKKKRKKKNNTKITVTEIVPNTVEENGASIVKNDVKSLNMDDGNLKNNESIEKEEQLNKLKDKKEEDQSMYANALHETQNESQNINEKFNDNMNIHNIPLPMEGSSNNIYEKNYHVNTNEMNNSMNYMYFNDVNNNISSIATNNNMYNTNYMNDYNNFYSNMMKNDFSMQAVHNLKNQGGKFDNELNNSDSYAMNPSVNLYNMLYMNMYNRLHQINDFSNTNKSPTATGASVEGNVRNESNTMNTVPNFSSNENANPCANYNMENFYYMNAHFNQLLEHMNRNPEKFSAFTHYTHNNDKQMFRYYGNSLPRGGKFNSNFNRVKYRNANYDFSRKFKNDPLGTNRNYMDRRNFIGNIGGGTDPNMIMTNKPNKNEKIMQMNDSNNPHAPINPVHAHPNIINTAATTTTTTTTNNNNNNNNNASATITKNTKNKNKNKNKNKENVVDPKETTQAVETVEASNNKKHVTVPIESSKSLLKNKNKKVNSTNLCKKKLIDVIPAKDVKESIPFHNVARMLEDGNNNIDNKGSTVCVEPDVKTIENNNVINTEIYKFIEDCVKCIGDDAFMSLIDEFSNNAAPTPNEKIDELKEIFDINMGGNEIDPNALEELKKGNEKGLLEVVEKEDFEKSNEIIEEKNDEVGNGGQEEKEKNGSETKDTVALPPGLSIPNINKALLHGAYLDRISFVKECIEKKADVNYSDKVGRTALHYACAGGYYEVCEFLIKSGAKVNIADYKNWTPLHIAVTKMHKEIAELLLKNQANIYALLPHALPPNRGKRTLSMSIHYAAIKGDKEMTKLLIEYGANVDDLDKADRTPLHYAACRKNSDYVKFLITELKAKVNVFDTHNRLPIHSACLGGNLENVKILLENGSMVEKLDIFNMSPADIAGMKNFHQIARFLRKFTRENYVPEEIIVQGGEKKQEKEEEIEGEEIEEDKNNEEHKIMDPKEFFNDNEKIKEALVSTTSVVLREKNVRQIKRVVDALGVYVSLFLLQKTCLIKNYGGMARDDKQGRRTSGGVYFFLIKYMYRQNIISRFKYDYIFEEEKEKKKTYRKLKKKLLQEEENKNSGNVEVKKEELKQREQEKKKNSNQRENSNSKMKCKGNEQTACNSTVIPDDSGTKIQTEENIQNVTNGTHENPNTLKRNGTNGIAKNATTKKKGAKLISAGTSTDHGYIDKSEIQGKGDSKNALVQTSKKLLASITNKNSQGKAVQATNTSGKCVLKNEKGVGPLIKPLKTNKTVTTVKEGEQGKLLHDGSTNAYNIFHQNKRFKLYNKKFLNNQGYHNYPNYYSPYFNKNFYRKKVPFMGYQVKRNNSAFRGTLGLNNEQTAGAGGIHENDIQFINYQQNLQNQQMQHIQQFQQLQQMQQLQQNGKKIFFNSNNGSSVQNENFKYPNNMNTFNQDFINYQNGVNPYLNNFQNSRCFFPNDLRNNYSNYMNNADMCMMGHFYDMYNVNNSNNNTNG